MGWSDCSKETPTALLSMRRVSSQAPGLLQVSTFLNKDQKNLGDTSPVRLMEMAQSSGKTQPGGIFVSKEGGNCRFGHWGTSIFRGPAGERLQIWFLSDGHDFITATHLCKGQSDQQEVSEVHQIILGLWLLDKP